MSLYQFSLGLEQLLETSRVLYVKLTPEVPDFTNRSSFKISILSPKLMIEHEVNYENIIDVVSLLHVTLLDKDRVDKLIFWNIKSLASYFKSKTGKEIGYTTTILDLKILENFCNIFKNSPQNLQEAINRLKRVVELKGIQPIYKTIHLPLAMRVLPSIESHALVDSANKTLRYPYYEIEGQFSGRLNSSKMFEKSYTPHTMGPDITSVLKPQNTNDVFASSDFRHCEVTILQWLSGDEKLKSVLDSGDDLHKRIYEIITESSCDTEEKRKISKKIFLPVMYGSGASSLSSRINASENICKELIKRIRLKFPTAWEWMMNIQDKAKSETIYDYFGRPRTFEPDKSYLSRCFAVQGVAATLCQEKMIALHDALESSKSKLAYSVHDGYGFVCDAKHARELYLSIRRTCESDSNLCPGLKMSVEIKFGKKLNEMRVVNLNRH